jgi:hypothetical protein
LYVVAAKTGYDGDITNFKDYAVARAAQNKDFIDNFAKYFGGEYNPEKVKGENTLLAILSDATYYTGLSIGDMGDIVDIGTGRIVGSFEGLDDKILQTEGPIKTSVDKIM